MEGLKEFVEPFVIERMDQDIENVANNLYSESKGTITFEEALKKAKYLVTYKPEIIEK